MIDIISKEKFFFITEKDCKDDPLLEQCKWLLNFYANYALKAVDDCTEVGVFPDSTSETKFYVCLDDSNSGFIKLPFSCSKDEYFDKSTSQCVSTALTETEGTTISESSTAGELTTSSDQPSSTLSASTDVSTTLTESSTAVSNNVESSTPLSTAEPFTSVPTTVGPQSSIPSTTEFSTTEPPSNTVTAEPPSTIVTTESSSTTVPTTVFTTTEPSQTTTQPFACTSPGIFPDPTNCLSEMTTPKPNSTPTTTTASTPTTTTTTTTAKPFTCPGAGVFPNPDDCKTYFRCNNAGKIFVLSCPGSSSFNEITKSCSLNLSPRCQKK
ncbi:Integumentary mucin A.1 precursor, putative [Pediculus humanus corporis]|uniref:Integumentary mucin A.1, putative n=1 Tax=Pediculus humanus subsp. corporis TaxID=121224 RepID=E0VPW8_PEDHC|nr:Integumentary mucin A.1 precursor, putative [Pediculus humanus corporis]EEB15424.1 Integumentary mucin A.1 precursor, putative [Pediculus humanus corporis]